MKDNRRKVGDYIKAEKLFIDPNDLQLDNQRSPEERKEHLTKLFGARGQYWKDDLAEAITVAERPNGMYAIKNGGGRWWAVMNLLKEPKKELLCVVMTEKISDLEAFRALNAGMHVPNGKIFMAKGNDPKNRYEHRVCNVLKENDYTTVPGRQYRTVSVKAVCFAYDLGVLNKTLALAKEYWGTKVSKLGKKKHIRVDGYAIAALAAFLFTYNKNPAFSLNRLEHVLMRVPFDELLDGAKDRLPPRKEHARQWAVALCKELVHRYNLGLSKQPKIRMDDISKLQEKIMTHENYAAVHKDVWETRKIIK